MQPLKSAQKVCSANDFRRIADKLDASGATVQAYCIHREGEFGASREPIANLDTVWASSRSSADLGSRDQFILLCDDASKLAKITDQMREASRLLPFVPEGILAAELAERDILGRWLELLFNLERQPFGPIFEVDRQTWVECFDVQSRDGLPSLFNQLVIPYDCEEIKRLRQDLDEDDIFGAIPPAWEMMLPPHYIAEIGDAETASQRALDWLADRRETSCLNEGTLNWPVPQLNLQSRKSSPKPRVVLYGRGERPTVDGQKVDMLTKARYDVVEALLKAGDAGLSKDALDRESRHEDARKILKRLSVIHPWGNVIRLAGSNGKRYRIV